MPVDGHRPRGRHVIALALVGGALLGTGCARSAAPATKAAQRSFLVTVHEQDPAIHQLRSDAQLLRLGSAACAGFAAGVSFFSLADTMAVNDGQLPTADLGTVIEAAAQHLCPRYRSRVS